MIKEAKQKTVKALLTKDETNKSYQYIIPPYQREYSWKEEQWENLFNDINENLSGYFLGSIICISSENNRLDVIDGQQRLTTLSLLLLALYDELNFYREYILLNLGDERISQYLSLKEYFLLSHEPRMSLSIQNNNNEDYIFIVNKILNKELVSIPKNYGNRRVARAFKYFSERIKQEVNRFSKDDEKVLALLNFLDKVTSALVVRIDTEDANSAFILFESINNRGMVLTPIDLIKNSLISHLSKNEKPDDINKLWQEVIKNVDDYEGQVRFLRHYYNAFSNVESYKFKVKVKDVSKATKSSLIKIYSDIIKNYGSLLIKDLIEKSYIYNKLLYPLGIESNDLYYKYRDSLINLNHIGVAPANTLLLYLFYNRKDQCFSNFLAFLEKWFIVRHLTNTPSTNKLDSIFIDLIRFLEGGGDISAVREKLIFELGDKNLVEKTLLEKDVYDFSSNLTKCLLVNIERCLSTKENIKDYWIVNEKNQQVWTVEHIYPRTARQENADKESESLKDKLGNLTITAYNGNLSNRSFIEKLELEKDNKSIGFNSGSIKINRGLQGKLTWESRDIKERTRWLIDEFLKDFL